LAHATLATTDLSVTACLLGVVYHFEVGRKRGWVRRVGIPALWYGIAITAKASALMFGPLCMVALELHRLWREGGIDRPFSLAGWWRITRDLRRDLYRIVPLGLVYTFAYCGTDWRPQKSFVEWAEHLPPDGFGQTMVWVANHLRIFPNAGEALVYQIKHNMRGHGVFLFDHWEPRAVWYYFPAALLLKLSIPLLALGALVLVMRPRALLGPTGWAALALLLFSLNCRVQIGIRLILPLVALFIISLAVALAQIRVAAASWPRWGRLVAVCGILAVSALPAALVWPNGLSYSNRLWGEPENGFRRLSDSNYDWGQGLPELARWQAAHPERPLCVWYYGTDPRGRTAPFYPAPLHQLPINEPADVERILRGAYLAVGTSVLFGNPDQSPEGHNALLALRQLRPVARTTTFFIYEFPANQRADDSP
jgi:hypothetical protein